jgi:hypothetical protein
MIGVLMKDGGSLYIASVFLAILVGFYNERCYSIKEIPFDKNPGYRMLTP